ncbi:MAG TPA: hypothetical protein VFG15_17420 [Amycolatopsis sp.]|nr:hypothetical protein [Amycolatopsis sp.]
MLGADDRDTLVDFARTLLDFARRWSTLPTPRREPPYCGPDLPRLVSGAAVTADMSERAHCRSRDPEFLVGDTYALPVDGWLAVRAVAAAQRVLASGGWIVLPWNDGEVLMIDSPIRQ